MTEFICDTLTNTCGADQTAKTTCATATAAAAAQPSGTGAQADAFNNAFGIITVCSSIFIVGLHVISNFFFGSNSPLSRKLTTRAMLLPDLP